jgi:hypothetical protein
MTPARVCYQVPPALQPPVPAVLQVRLMTPEVLVIVNVLFVGTDVAVTA